MSTYRGCRWHPITDTTFHLSMALLRSFPITLKVAVGEGFEPPVVSKATFAFKANALNRALPSYHNVYKYIRPIRNVNYYFSGSSPTGNTSEYLPMEMFCRIPLDAKHICWNWPTQVPTELLPIAWTKRSTNKIHCRSTDMGHKEIQLVHPHSLPNNESWAESQTRA